MKTRAEFADWLDRQSRRMEPLDDNIPKPDREDCQRVAKKAGKLAVIFRLGGDPARLGRKVEGPEDCLALLGDCLQLLGDEPESGSSNPQETFNVRQAAIRLGCSQRKLYDLVGNQLIGHYRIGRAIRFTLADLEEYQQTESPPDPIRVPALGFRHLT